MAAFVTDLKTTAGIVTAQGSSLVMLKEVDSAGAELVDSAWFSFPIVSTSSLNNSVTEETVTGEGNETYTLDGGTTERTFELTMLQRDTAALKFVRYDAVGKYFSIVKERNRTAINGKHQYDVIGIAKISTNWSESLPSTERTVSFAIQNNDTALTVDVTDLIPATTGFKASLLAVPAVIPADQGTVLIEAVAA